MTPDQRFTLLILAISLVFTMLCAVFGLLWRAASKAGSTLNEIKGAAEDIKNCQSALDRHIQWHMSGRRPNRDMG